MSESSTPTETSATSKEDAAPSAQSANGSSPFNLDALKSVVSTGDAPETVDAPDQPRRRKVYESNLIPDRKGKRAPSSIILLAIILVAGILAYIVYAPHPRRFVATAGKMV